MAIETINTSQAKEVNITHYRGDTFFLEKKFYTDATKSTILDITTDNFKMNVVKADLKSKSSPILSFTMSNGISIVPTNILRLTKTASEMQFSPGIYTYDLQRTLSDGKVVTVEFGTWEQLDDRTI